MHNTGLPHCRRKRNIRPATLASVSMLALLLAAQPATATDWIAVAGDWNDPANWSSGVPLPTVTNGHAYINNGGTAEIFSGSVGSAWQLALGRDDGESGNLILYVDSHLNILNFIDIGNDNSSSSESLLDINGGALVIYSGSINRSGRVVLHNGGTLTPLDAFGLSGGTLEIGDGGNFNGPNISGAPLYSSSVLFNNSGNSTFDVDILNYIAVTHSGSGTTTLFGDNTYSLGTMLNAGTLAVFNDDNLGASTGTLTFDGGTLRIISGFSMDRATTLDAGGGTFDTAASTTLTQAGDISGAGSLAKTGGGTLVLSGSNSYAGGTSINGGTLSVSGDSNLGASTGTLSFNGGTLQATGTFSMDRDTTLNAGGGTFNTLTGTTLTQNGDISGAGGLAKTGAGTLTLSGSNSYAGGTSINGGTLSVSGDSNLGVSTGTLSFNGGTLQATGNVSMNRATTLNAGGGTFDTIMGVTLTQDGNISGSGGLTKTGGGSLGIWGVNTYTGTTLIQQGTLLYFGSSSPLSAHTIATGALMGTTGNPQTIGSLAGGGTVAIYGPSLTTGGDNSSTIFSGDIQGSGDLIKTGSGTFTLSGTNAYTGDTIVAGGRLVVDGSITSAVVLQNGGTLGGSGSIGNLNVTGGIVAPGNSIGTLNVTGNYTLGSAATYEVEIRDGGNTPGLGGHNDLIAVTGNATLDTGAGIHVTPENGTDNGSTYASGTTYTILTSGSGLTVNGAQAITDDFAYLDFAGSFDANNYYLTSSLLGGASSFCLSGMSGNQCGAGNGAFSLGAGNSVYDAVLGMSAPQAAAALNQLSGEVHASAQSALLMGAERLRGDVLARLRMANDDDAGAVPQGKAPEGSQDPFWMRVGGSTANLDGNGNAATLSSHDWSLLAGLDDKPGALGGDWRLGVLAGYSHTRFSVSDRLSSGESDNVHLGVYGARQWDRLALRLGAMQSWHWLDSERTALGQRLQSDTTASTFQSFGELGYAFTVAQARLEPFANATWLHQRTDGFAESGGSAALTVGDASNDTGFTTLGLRGAALLEAEGAPLALRGSLGWRHAMGDIEPENTMRFLGGTAFTVSGAPLARDAAVLEAGLDLTLTEASTLSLGYDGQFSDDIRAHGGRVQYTLKF